VGPNDLEEHNPTPSTVEVVCYSETLIPIYLTKLCHNPDKIMNEQDMQEACKR
jgi:hypothetical protein